MGQVSQGEAQCLLFVGKLDHEVESNEECNWG